MWTDMIWIFVEKFSELRIKDAATDRIGDVSVTLGQ